MTESQPLISNIIKHGPSWDWLKFDGEWYITSPFENDVETNLNAYIAVNEYLSQQSIQ